MHVYSQLHALLSYLYHKVFNEGMQVIRNSKETVFPSHSNFQLQIKKYQLRINLKLIKLLSESLKWKKLLYFHNNSIQFCPFSQVKRDLKERMFNLEKWHFKKCQNRVLQQLKIFFFLPAFLLKEGISLELAHIQFQLQEGCALQRKGFCQLPQHRELSR